LIVVSAANAVLAAVAIAVPLDRLRVAYPTNDWWSYQASEWLINFGGGFARRGLAGELLRMVPGVEDRLAVTVLVGTLMVAVPVLFGLLVQRSMMLLGVGWPLLLWGVPGGLLLGLLQGEWLPLRGDYLLFATRKEYLFTVVLLAFALGVSRSRHPTRWALGFGLVLVPLAFVHEGLTFIYALAGAALAAIVLARDRPWRGAAAVLLPAGMAVLLTVPFASPGAQQQQQMWAALDGPTQQWLGGQVPGPFELLGYSVSEARDYAAQATLPAEIFVQWVMIGAFVLAWTVLALLLVDHSISGLRATMLTAGLMAVAFVPLMIVAIDWGRFFVIAATCTAIVGLARASRFSGSVTPAPLNPLTIAGAVLMIGALALVGVPEAGPPFGEQDVSPQALDGS